MSTQSILRFVAVFALVAAVPVFVLWHMFDLTLALAACSAVSAVLSLRRGRTKP